MIITGRLFGPVLSVILAFTIINWLFILFMNIGVYFLNRISYRSSAKPSQAKSSGPKQSGVAHRGESSIEGVFLHIQIDLITSVYPLIAFGYQYKKKFFGRYFHKNARQEWRAVYSVHITTASMVDLIPFFSVCVYSSLSSSSRSVNNLSVENVLKKWCNSLFLWIHCCHTPYVVRKMVKKKAKQKPLTP